MCTVGHAWQTCAAIEVLGQQGLENLDHWADTLGCIHRAAPEITATGHEQWTRPMD
jgi:hypothetical protein